MNVALGGGRKTNATRRRLRSRGGSRQRGRPRAHGARGVCTAGNSVVSTLPIRLGRLQVDKDGARRTSAPLPLGRCRDRISHHCRAAVCVWLRCITADVFEATTTLSVPFHHRTTPFFVVAPCQPLEVDPSGVEPAGKRLCSNECRRLSVGVGDAVRAATASALPMGPLGPTAARRAQ